MTFAKVRSTPTCTQPGISSVTHARAGPGDPDAHERREHEAAARRSGARVNASFRACFCKRKCWETKRPPWHMRSLSFGSPTHHGTGLATVDPHPPMVRAVCRAVFAVATRTPVQIAATDHPCPFVLAPGLRSHVACEQRQRRRVRRSPPPHPPTHPPIPIPPPPPTLPSQPLSSPLSHPRKVRGFDEVRRQRQQQGQIPADTFLYHPSGGLPVSFIVKAWFVAWLGL